MTAMEQIFILLVLRFGKFADFGYRRQRQMLCGNGSSPETMRTKNGVHFTVNSVARNGSFRNGFKFFAETFSKEHYRSAIISKQPVGTSAGKNTNPQMSSNFPLFIQSTTAVFSLMGFPFRFFPLLFSAFFENFYPVWRSA